MTRTKVSEQAIVQMSDDEDSVKGVTTVFNNDHDNSSRLGIGEEVHGTAAT